MTSRPVLCLSLACVAFCASIAFLAGPRFAGADDEKKGYDDENIFKDQKLVKARGASHAKERGEYWASKGIPPDKLVWLGVIWLQGQEGGKAVEAEDKFLKYVATDTKLQETVEKNHGKAYEVLMQGASLAAHRKQGEWADAVKACERYRAEFPNGAIARDSWEAQGRAHRWMGDDDKALACFKNAADQKMRLGVTDMVDVHLAHGKADEAKAVLEKYMQEEIQGKEQYFIPLQEFVNSVGTAAPSLEKAVSVGKTAAAGDWKGRPAVFYHWTMQTNGGDARLERFESVRLGSADKANFAALSTYNKYNPESSKIEEGMTEAQEVTWYQLFLEKSPRHIPPCIVVPKGVKDGLRQKFEGQFTILDAEGKFYWVRITDTWMFDKTPYDFETVALALKKFPTSAEPAPAASPTKSGDGAIKPPDDGPMKPPDDR